MPAECAVEVGKVGETDFKGDVGDLSILIYVANQEFFRLFKSLSQNMPGESLTGLLEQQLNITWRDAHLRGDSGGVQAVIGQSIRNHS